jgi:cyclic pyranopterin phosphate synthase
MNLLTNHTPLIAVVAARSGTGKTTVLQRLVAYLSGKGYRVATLKHVHQAHLDLPGKDSWKHKASGAVAVGLTTPEEYITISARDETQDPHELLRFLPEVDLVLAEGFRHSSLPKIEVVRAELGREVVTSATELAALITDVDGLNAPVPIFPLDQPEQLAEWIMHKFLHPEAVEDLKLTHLDPEGRARMVDVTAKAVTFREATAKGEVSMKPETLALIERGAIAKGDVLAVAQVAAVMAVKETPRLIPMCHPLNISGVTVNFQMIKAGPKIEITVRVKLSGQTGVEMEALTGVSVAALTIYDMCKAVDKTMEIGRIRLIEKSGGVSGHFIREEA